MASDLTTGIYEIRNTINGKRYVGSAVDFGNRWRVHVQSLNRGDHHSRALQRAWRRYSPRAFQFNRLLVCSKEHLIMYEQICMDAMKPEYNCAPKAGSQMGFKHSLESRGKMAAAARRTKNFTGRTHSAESRAKISAAKTGVKLGCYDHERVARTAEAMRAGKGALTESDVRLIREWNQRGVPHRFSAAFLGCTYWAVADVVRGATFKWVK